MWVSGWCPSFSVCGMAVVCAAAVLPSAVVWLVPYSPYRSAGEYCCHVVHCSLPGAWCVGGGCVSVLFVWWGILCLLPPLVVVEGGAIVDGGACVWWVGGMAIEGWQCCWPPRRMSVSPSVCWRPPSVCVVVLLNGGSGVCCDAHVRIGSGILCCPTPSRIVRLLSPFVFAVTALLV